MIPLDRLLMARGAGETRPVGSASIDRLRQIAAAWHRAVHVDSSMLPVHICDLDAVLADVSAERTRADAAEADRDALRAEVGRLRAIVEGSATPPTDAEIDAHWRVGGAWLVSGSVVTGAYEVRRLASLGIAHLTWVPLSGALHGRTPCPWPVTP